MKLAISVLGNKADNFLSEALTIISTTQCTIVEMRSGGLTRLTSVYMLLEGNWNCIAKLEGLLDGLAQQLAIQIVLLRPDEDVPAVQGVPYLLETISMEKKDLLLAVSSFLIERGVIIEEINAGGFKADFFQNKVYTSKFVLLIPGNVHILSIREEFLDFCDALNIDAILEPIKH